MKEKPLERPIGIKRDPAETTEWALRERIKELTCLYLVNRDLQKQLPVEELCRRIIEYLVPAMQFPEITVPVIEFQDRRFASEKYTHRLSHGLHAELKIKEEVLGNLWVYYAEGKPFLIPEEQQFVKAIAEALGLWFEGRRAQEALVSALQESRRRQEEVAALLEGSKAVLEHHDFKEAARSIFNSCKQSTGATAGYVALLNKDGTENEVLFLDFSPIMELFKSKSSIWA